MSSDASHTEMVLQHGPVLCFDLDGTLLDDRERIHPADREILTSARTQAILIPTTGRPLESVRRTFQRNGLFEGGSLPLPLVLLNGSLVHAPGERRLAYRPFEPLVQSGLIALAQDFPDVTFLFLGEGPAQMLHPSPFGWAAAERYECTTQEFTSASREVPSGKVMCMHPDHAVLEPLDRALEGVPVEKSFSVPFSLELTARGVDKGSGLQILLERLDLAGRPLLAAGDGGNDLPLLSQAKVFFVPTSAPPEVREKATVLVDVPCTGLLGPMLEYAFVNFRL